MALQDVAALIAKDFVTVKLDLDRGIGAKEIKQRYINSEQGLPWFAFLDKDGKCLIDSTRPDGGNIGHPFKPEEVAHFKTMLLKVRKNLSDGDINLLIQSINRYNHPPGQKPADIH